MRDYLSLSAWAIGIFMLGSLLFVGGGFLNLWWMPFNIQMQTGITRNSNSYVTTKQQEILELVRGYNTAETDGQKRSILAMICMDATLIPGNIPPSAVSLLQECGR